MNNREKRFALLVRVYPKAYRSAHGEEIMATLLDASMDNRSFTRDVVDVALHGLQIRLGLHADRFGGRVLALAAAPGTTMAGALALLMFTFTEWRPIMTHAPIALRFGPFWTIGPVVYLTWFLGAMGALLWPRRQRVLALASVAVTLVAIPVGDMLFARPNLWELMLVVALGLPAIFAPSLETRRPPLVPALASGVVMLAIVAAWELGDSRGLFLQGIQLSHATPYGAGVVMMLIGALRISGRSDAAGAVAVLLAPWLMIGAAYPYRRTGANTVDAVVLGVLGAWLALHWIVDLRRSSATDLGST